MYLNFVGGVCIILSRWLKEADITEKSCIDYTIYYWKPPSQWTNEDWNPSCFEKYLSNCWGKDLPKMLLTSDVHNIFKTHIVNNDCCSSSELGIFKLSKSICPKSFHLNVTGICKSGIAICKKHTNCHLKIQHNRCCLEPYLCYGHNPCILTCETAEKTKSKLNTNDFWTKSSIEFFACKEKNKRSVSTFVESVITQVETFCPIDEICKNDNSTFHDMMELFISNTDSGFRNSYNQHKQKEEYRKKLRKKFYQKYDYEEGNVEDPIYLEQLYDRAQTLWLQELWAETYHNLFHGGASNDRDKLNKCLTELNYRIRTVAVGTDSIVFGLLVKPSKKMNLSLNVNTGDATKMLQTKPKKRRANKVIKNPVLKSDLGVVSKSENKISEKNIEVNVSELSKNESIVLDKICENKNKSKQVIDTKPLNSSCEITKDIGESSNSLLTTDMEEDLNTFYNFVKTDVCEIDLNSKECNGALDGFCEKSGTVSEIKKNKCKICAFCQKKETQPKTFKRCSRCKTEHFSVQRYYCSRNCQIADWEKSHRDEHLNKITD